MPFQPASTICDPDAAITAIARYYDLDFAGHVADIDMYRNFGRLGAGRVLELGAGTGRVAVPLAEAGCSVVAVEANAAMRATGAARCRTAGVRVVAEDMRTVRLGQTFDLIIFAFSTFCHLQRRCDQQQALETVAAHLAPEGLAIFDLPPLSAADWELGPRAPLWEWTRRDPSSGRLVSKFATLEADPAAQTQQVTYLYDEQREDGTVERTIARFALRHVFRYEIEGLLETAGLRLSRLYGSYDLDPVEAGERLIVVARRADEDEGAS